MRSVLDNGLSKTWTIFAQNANISLTLIRHKISMRKRQKKILLIEWEPSFNYSNNKINLIIRDKITKSISLDLRNTNRSS